MSPWMSQLYLALQRVWIHWTLSIDKFALLFTQGCHAIVVRNKVLGHEVAIGQHRRTTGRSSGSRTLAEIKMLRQPRLLQRRRWWRWQRRRRRRRCGKYEHVEKDADRADAFRDWSRNAGSWPSESWCNTDDAAWSKVWRFGGIDRWTCTGSRTGAARCCPRPRHCGPHIRPGILLRCYKVRASFSLPHPLANIKFNRLLIHPFTFIDFRISALERKLISSNILLHFLNYGKKY